MFRRLYSDGSKSIPSLNRRSSLTNLGDLGPHQQQPQPRFQSTLTQSHGITKSFHCKADLPRASVATETVQSSELAPESPEIGHVYANPAYPSHFETSTVQIGGLPFYIPRDAAAAAAASQGLSLEPHQKLRDIHSKWFIRKLSSITSLLYLNKLRVRSES